MSWERAMHEALARANTGGRHWYVRGYRTTGGRWRYGIYRQDRPALASRGWV